MLEKVKAVVVFFLVLAFCSNGYEALESQVNEHIKEAYWYILIFGLSIGFLVLSPMETLRTIPKNVFIWIILFSMTLVYSYAFSSESDVVNSLVKISVKALSVFVSMFVLVTSEKILRAGYFALLAVIVLSVLLNVYEYFFSDTVIWSTIPGRAAGWFYEANTSARNISMSLIFASLVIPKKFIWPLIIFASFGVFITFSRGGWIELFLVIVGISILSASKPGQKVSFLDIKPSSFIFMSLGAFAATIMLALFVSGQAYELVKGTPIESHLSADTINRLKGGHNDASAHERTEVLIAALEMGSEHPFLGNGLARTHEWGHAVAPHNDYATLFAERGMVGVIVYLGLLGLIWFSGSGYAKLFAIVLAFSSITSHTTFDSPSTFIFIAFALLYKPLIENRLIYEQQQAEAYEGNNWMSGHNLNHLAHKPKDGFI